MATLFTYSPNIIFTLNISICVCASLFTSFDKCLKINFPYYDSSEETDLELKGNLTQDFEPVKIPVDWALHADSLVK